MSLLNRVLAVKNQSLNTSISFLTILVLPLFLGLIMYGCLISLINGGVIESEILTRYVTGHSVSLVTTAMFCIGVAALMLATKNVFDQHWLRDKIKLKESKNRNDSHDGPLSQTDLAKQLQDQLILQPKRFREFYLWNRLYAALDYVNRNNSTEHIDDELKYLAEADTERQYDRFALVRILIWATPMLGFLGTVLGISQALGSLDVGAQNDFSQMLGGLRESLYVAFDTTALALTFAILLMFGQFIVDRFDSQLLTGVDQRCRHELGRFYEMTRQSKDPTERMLEKIGKQIGNQLSVSLEDVANQQVDIWSESMLQANEQWQENAKILHQQWDEAKSQFVTIQNKWQSTCDSSRQCWQEDIQTLHDQFKQTSQSVAAQWEEARSQFVSVQNKWQNDAENSRQHWQKIHETTGDIIEERLVTALDKVFDRLTQGIEDAVTTADDRIEQRWQQIQVSMSESIRHNQGQQADLTDTIENFKQIVQQQVDVLPDIRQKFTDSMTESLQASQQRQQELAVAIEQFREIVDAQSQLLPDVRPEAESNSELRDSVARLNELLERIAENDRVEPNRELKLRIIGPTASRAA